MTEPKRTNIWWIFAIAICLSVVFFSEAYGDDGHGHDHNNGDVLVDVVGGDIAGSRSYGISGSDMDIGQCIFHAGALTVAVGLRNKFCEGMEMIRMGMVDAGILHICKQTKIGRNYKNLKDCKDGLAIVYIDPTPNDTQDGLGVSEPTQDEENDDISHLYALISDLEDRDAQRTEEAEKAAQRPVPQPQTIIQQQEFINDSKRARLEALRGEK